MQSIMNFYRYSDTLAAGGQPTKEQLTSLRNSGFDTIINISPTSTRNYLADEAAHCEKLGFNYIHYPVDCGNLKNSHYTLFSSILTHAEGSVFVHCGGNIKSSALIHAWQVLSLKADEKESLQKLLSIHTPEEKWFTFYKKLGMKGLNSI